MPSRPARTARSSSKSSKTSERGSAGLVSTTPDPTAVAIGLLGSPHGLRGALRLWPHQPGAPSLEAGRRVLLERDGAWLAATVTEAAPHGRGMLLVLAGVTDRTAAAPLTGMRIL